MAEDNSIVFTKFYLATDNMKATVRKLRCCDVKIFECFVCNNTRIVFILTETWYQVNKK